jgi:hypothetical protein
MRSSGGRAAHKLACLRRIIDAKLPEEKTYLLLDFVEAYLELTPEETQEYKILAARYHRRATAVWMTWSERMKEEGKREGLKLGEQKGLQTLQQILLLQLEQRFGPLSERVRSQVEAIDSLRRLTRLAERVLTVNSLRELRLR